MEMKYLDKAGAEYLIAELLKRIEALNAKIELLNNDDNTPGSIRQIVHEIIADTSVNDLKQDDVTIYGGTASEVMRGQDNG